MDHIKVYDYLTLARSRILAAVRGLSDEQFARQFPIGLGTLGRTLTHTMISEWYYVQRMHAREVPPYAEWPIRDDTPLPPGALASQWTRQATETRASLGAITDWSATVEYRVTRDDDGRMEIVTATKDELFTQLAFHEVHHRAQAMNILRQFGLQFGDLDFNSMMYQRRPASP